MRRHKIGHLQIFMTRFHHRSSNDRALYIDWRVSEWGKRWRIQIQPAPMWFPLFSPIPTKRGKWWAYWAIGNEQGNRDIQGM